ncbi:MAG: 4Fe-4S binding protein [Synergistaceae bacterium]|jgi:2-oxoglutarate ferredoxin oxidoreductase subunit delta|nr:4Fe-4S binding protein [Synergistaceae bacterium]
MPYSLSIDRRWCKKCGLCVRYCPKNVYDADPLGAPVIARAQDCVGCIQCEARCPDFALTVENTPEKHDGA